MLFLLFVFALGILALAGVGVAQLSEVVKTQAVEEIQQISGLREGPITRALERAIDAVDPTDLALPFILLFLAVLAFGFAVAHVALKPTRDALASQKQFIGNVAHELRTPLAIVKTNIEVALLDDGLDNELRHVLRDNVDELDRSSDIINNLLSLNTLLNPSDIPFTTVDFGHVAEEAVAKLAALATRREVHLSLRKKDFVLVEGNETALLQVALNLVKNALTHTPAGGNVRITVEPDYRGYIELAVHDTGAGIASEDLLHIFEPFYQADRSRSRKYGGSGLGLTIVSEIVKLHGGKILMQSSEQKGTNATVAIPCAAKSGTEKPGASEDTEKVTMDFSRTKHAATPRL